MVTMEIKGITWVGDIYQKFENMCLEAEEVIYEVCLSCPFKFTGFAYRLPL